MQAVEVLSIGTFVLALLLPLLTLMTTFGSATGAVLAFALTILLGVLAVLNSRPRIRNLLVLGAGSALGNAFMYIFATSEAGDIAFLMQAALLGLVSLTAFVPPL